MLQKIQVTALAACALTLAACAQMSEPGMIGGMFPAGNPAVGAGANNGPALGPNYDAGTPQCDHWGTGICYTVSDNPRAPMGRESNRSIWLGARY